LPRVDAVLSGFGDLFQDAIRQDWGASGGFHAVSLITRVERFNWLGSGCFQKTGLGGAGGSRSPVTISASVIAASENE
jgi:hypothetical protein